MEEMKRRWWKRTDTTTTWSVDPHEIKGWYSEFYVLTLSTYLNSAFLTKSKNITTKLLDNLDLIEYHVGIVNKMKEDDGLQTLSVIEKRISASSQLKDLGRLLDRIAERDRFKVLQMVGIVSDPTLLKHSIFVIL